MFWHFTGISAGCWRCIWRWQGGAVINSEEFLKFQSKQHVELYMRYLRHDSQAGEVSYDQEKATSLALQAKLNSFNCEHGNAYIEGIQPCFDILKAHLFDSSWNWVCQDALLTMISFLVSLPPVDQEITVRCIALLNQANPDMLQFMQYNSIS